MEGEFARIESDCRSPHAHELRIRGTRFQRAPRPFELP